jgi:hypothetical protein
MTGRACCHRDSREGSKPIIPRQADNTGRQRPTIPNVDGLSLLDAALAYADAGIYLLLVTTGKHPGSLVGKGWPAKSTRNPDTTRAWCAANPNGGIAIHTGRSGLVVADLDVDVIPGELIWLKGGLFQSSRGGRGARGHYVFASTETFVSGKLKLKAGTVVGEIRSGNTAIITQPSPHQKAENGGEYRWITHGLVPELPDAAHDYLSTKAGGRGGESLSITTGTKLAEYLAAHTAEREPWRRKSFRDKYAEYVRNGEKHHDAMMKVLFWAAREVADELVSATLFDDLYDDFEASYGPDDRTPESNEFAKMLAEAINEAAKEDRDTLHARHTRDFGTDHRDYARVFDGFEFIVQSPTADADIDEEPFWSSSDQLKALRQFARSRRGRRCASPRCRLSPTRAAPARHGATPGRRSTTCRLCKVLGFEKPEGVLE